MLAIVKAQLATYLVSSAKSLKVFSVEHGSGCEGGGEDRGRAACLVS